MILKANAKINLTLDITGKRDDGYHLIDSVFQSVSVCDTVKLTKSDAISVKFSCCDVDGKSSIAFKAAAAFFDYTKINGGAKIEIESCIPVSSGMGGGSSDAASVLVGLNKLYGTNLTVCELTEIGSKIGADIPFCIVGGTARVEGIGEKVTPLKNIENTGVLIIKEGEKLSTADMYKKLDAKPINPPKTEIAVNAINAGNTKEVFENISNSFGSVYDFKYEKELLEGTGALAVGLSGSGPSVFGIFNAENELNTAYEKLKSMNINVYKASFKNTGIEVISE